MCFREPDRFPPLARTLAPALQEQLARSRAARFTCFRSVEETTMIFLSRRIDRYPKSLSAGIDWFHDPQQRYTLAAGNRSGTDCPGQGTS